jgi:RNA 2',3'-cyclic 3'-phosphodiesterase
VRVFVALDIPEEVRAAIGALIEKLRPTSKIARWVRIEGVHVTLKFIGEVPPEKIAAIKVSLSQIRFTEDIALKFRGVGFFPNERRPRVLWAGIEAGEELGALAAAVEAALERLGIAKEQRAFSPHLTLARFDTARHKPSASAFERLHETISKAGPLEFGSSTASEFHLYQSTLKRGGAEYTRLATFRFAGGESQ